MCGIAGIYHFQNAVTVEQNLIQRMTDIIRHRGPDADGVYVNGRIGLGHRRLSIIDLSEAGRQPMFSADRRLSIVFNGEIYNYLDYRDDLRAKGHQFHSRTDTEVIIYLYREYGVECLSKLRGMFAFAIWEEDQQRLFLAIDRLGQKPLYYYSDGQRLLFGSELKCLLEDPDVPREIDYEALYDYLVYRYIPAPKTIYKNIYKLPPAHYMLCTRDGLHGPFEYWDISFAHVDKGKSESQYQEELLHYLRESVKIRLMSDVPLGAFLSGGVDSSAIVALMAQVSDSQCITTSIGFREKEVNELEFARVVSQQYHTDHFERMVDADAASILEKIVWHHDEPFADNSSVPTYYVSKLSREKVTVALSGDAGDESFAGYSKYPIDKLENIVRSHTPRIFRQSILPVLARIYPKWDWLPWYFRGNFFLNNVIQSPAYAFYRTNTFLTDEQQNAIFSNELQQAFGGYSPFHHIEHFYNKSDAVDPLSRVQYIDMKFYMPADILVKVDRMSMANSLEVRSPLIDHRLMEYVATIPSSLKLHGFEKKYIFKKTLQPYLPESILSRKKQGFIVPLDRWFRQDLKQLVEDTVFSPSALQRGFFNESALQSMWREHQAGYRNFGTIFWTLLIFELWYARFMPPKDRNYSQDFPLGGPYVISC